MSGPHSDTQVLSRSGDTCVSTRLKDCGQIGWIKVYLFVFREEFYERPPTLFMVRSMLWGFGIVLLS